MFQIDANRDIGIRSSQAAEVTWQREQKIAQEADQKIRDAAKQADEKTRNAIKAQQEQDAFSKRASEDLLKNAEKNAGKQAQEVGQLLDPHNQEVPLVNHREITQQQAQRIDDASQIRQDFLERGQMRDSHAMTYPVRGGNTFEQAANRELDADKDFANRQNQLGKQIESAGDNGDREYLTNLKNSEYHSHKAESWNIITSQRQECGYPKEDIEYARNQAASYEMQAAHSLEKLRDLDKARVQEQGTQRPAEQDQRAQQTKVQGQQNDPEQQPTQDAQNAQQATQRPAQESRQTPAGQSNLRGEKSDPEAPDAHRPGSVSQSSFAALDRISAKQDQEPPSSRSKVGSLRDDIVKLEQRHNTEKEKQGEHSQGLRGDIERLEERHNAQKAGQEQGRQQDQKESRRDSGFERY